MRLLIVFMFLTIFQVSANVSFAQARVTIDADNISLEKFFLELRKQTGNVFIFNNSDINARQSITVTSQNETVTDLLDRVLKDLNLGYTVMDEYIVIHKQQQQPQIRTINGRVVGNDGLPLPGVTVVIKGTTRGTSTNTEGNYVLTIPTDTQTLVFSFIGFDPKEIVVDQQMTTVNVTLVESTTDIDEVVATGIYTRAKESFTGSATTFSRKELQMIGNQNVLQSLKTLDPSFAVIESNEFGSDPNRLLDIEIRGKTSVVGLTEEYGVNPNQPLFILDGFESTLRAISDLSMDMIESITILKDAASTAIYGSKSANGVVVVETRKPEAGQLRITYKGDFSLSFPDLQDYNLMNSREKIEFERLSLRWGTIDENNNIIDESNFIDYMRVYKDIERGVNTDWLNIPLRNVLSNRHNVYVEGGTSEVRYGIGINYGNTKGVMKGSDRETIGGNFQLMYRWGDFSFNNRLMVDNVTANRENVAFSRFARMNPYFRKYDENGLVPKIQRVRLYNSYYTFNNPMWDMELNNIDKESEFSFSNNLEIIWNALEALRVRGRFGVGKTAMKRTIFRSPFHTDFINSTQEQTGSYQQSDGDGFSYYGDASVSYGELLNGIHRINVVTGFSFRQDNSNARSFSVTGFIDEDYPNPNFALGYRPDSKPTYSESTRRSADYYINTGYSYKERYLLDANYRLDGTSIFGSSRRFAHTWSVGLAWNVHNEAFWGGSGWLDNLKIRASIGNPGNQNFNDYISLMVYRYNLENPNIFGPSMLIEHFGNSGLDWQKTIDKNIGFDLAMYGNRLKVNFDYFHKVTNPLLVHIGTPSSTGVTSLPTNLGKQITEGMTAIASGQIISSRDIVWLINGNIRMIKSRYEDIGDLLNKYNLENYGTSLMRYYDGGSPNDLWAVRSQGIDPATGREVFITKEGTETFLYDYADEVKVGNTEPDMEGTFGTSFRYKGLSVAFSFRYRLGGQAFMSTLYNKVENIAERFENQDKRALHDRWKNPGDQAKFMGVWVNNARYYMSSRFVMDNNVLSGESISVSYETQADWLRYIGASSLTFNGYMNDIFRISSIKNERGISYPFAHSVSFSLGLRF